MKKKILSALLLAAFGFAVTSTVTSCKDYDDDINNLQTQIDALTPKLTALQTDLTNQLNSAKSELQTAIAAKADAKTVTDLAGKVATLETQLGTANDAISKLRTDVNGALKDIATLTGDYKTLRGDLDDEVKAREALEANLKVQLAAHHRTATCPTVATAVVITVLIPNVVRPYVKRLRRRRDHCHHG